MTDSGFHVYDKVRWHWPERPDCPSLDAAKRHINFAMQFLADEELLSEDGEDLFEDGMVYDDFALTSEMVNEEGHRLLARGYALWLKQISYDGPLSRTFFEEQLRALREEE